MKRLELEIFLDTDGWYQLIQENFTGHFPYVFGHIFLNRGTILLLVCQRFYIFFYVTFKSNIKPPGMRAVSRTLLSTDMMLKYLLWDLGRD